MLVKRFGDCSEITANDGCRLRELLHPDKDGSGLPYSLAVARVEPGQRTLPHRLTDETEVYYVVPGEGTMHIDDAASVLRAGDAVVIPGRRRAVDRVHRGRDAGVRRAGQPALAGGTRRAGGVICRQPSAGFPDPAEPPVPSAELLHGPGQVLAVEIGPELLGEEQLRVGALPEQEIAQSLLSAGADHQVHVRCAGAECIAWLSRREKVSGETGPSESSYRAATPIAWRAE